MSALAAYVGGLLSGAGVMAALARRHYGPTIARLETALKAADQKLAAPPPEPLIRYLDRYIERPAESSPPRTAGIPRLVLEYDDGTYGTLAAPDAPATAAPPPVPTRPEGHAERFVVIRRTAEGYELLHAGDGGAEAGRQYAAAAPTTGAVELWDGPDPRGTKPAVSG